MGSQLQPGLQSPQVVRLQLGTPSFHEGPAAPLRRFLLETPQPPPPALLHARVLDPPPLRAPYTALSTPWPRVTLCSATLPPERTARRPNSAAACSHDQRTIGHVQHAHWH